MVKNRKGFTLVELLAAIVILGILMVFSVPIIVGMLDRSKDKIYVDDAKKMISQAEYQMRSSSNEIEVPDPGNCIVISLVYLDNSSFDNPPNKGEYEREYSFVVVKNEGGKLKYSATIVENVKGGGYKGVKLSTSEVLYSRNALKQVTTFNINQLKKPTIENNSAIMKMIKDNLGNDYFGIDGEITEYYNYPNNNTGNAISGDNFSPKIKKALVSSVENYSSLTAKLSLIVSDQDTPIDQLKVFISLDNYTEDESKAMSYGNKEEFTYNLDFSSQTNYENGGDIKIYVVVKDPQGNVARKVLNYSIQKNFPPEIGNNSSISKREWDPFNMTTALVNLSVTDDISSFDDLEICLVDSDSTDVPSCTDYRPYNEVVSNGSSFEYEFKCGNKCNRDGTTHYLNVFIRDKQKAVATKQLSYTFSDNAAPEFVGDITVTSKNESFANVGSKNVTISFNAKDDIDKPENLKVKISDGVHEDKYNDNQFDSYDFTFDNVSYNGATKSVTVTVTDSEGKSTSKTFSNYSLYRNKAPVISEFSVTTREIVCNNPNYYCSITNGGSKNVNAVLSLTDDLDIESDYKNVKVCVSDNQNYCNDESHYVSYKNYFEKEVPLTLNVNEYRGQDVVIYAYAMDTYGEKSYKTYNYKLYDNQVPVITFFNVQSKKETFTEDGSLNVIFSISAEDDFNTSDDLTFKLYEGDTEVKSGKLSDFEEKDNLYTISGGYDGREVNLKAVVIDSGNLIDESIIPYHLYRQKEPMIESVTVEPNGVACFKENICSIENNNPYTINYSISILDPDSISDSMPNGDLSKFEVCVNQNNSCSNYKPISDYYDSNYVNPKKKEFTFEQTGSKPYLGQEKTLYVFVRRKGTNDVISSSQTYTIYNNNSPVITSSPVVTEVDRGKGLANVNYSISVDDDLDSSLQIKYCKKINEGNEECGNYQTLVNNVDYNLNNNNFFNIDSYNGQNVLIYTYIKDSYGEEIKSEEFEYKLHGDSAPNIDSVHAIYEINYVDENGNIVPNENITESNINRYSMRISNAKVSFKATDVLDNYSYCISTSDSSCNDYESTIFSGDDTSIHYVMYTKGSSESDFFVRNESNGQSVLNPKTFYLYLKDSHGNVSKGEFEFNVYSVCAAADDNTREAEFTFVPDKQYKDDQGNIVTNNQPISMNNCGGKCYYYDVATNTYNNIVSYYDKKINYIDRYDSSKTCVEKILKDGVDEESFDEDNYTTVQDYTAKCDFYKCFENRNGNYVVYAIGTNFNPLVYSEKVGGQEYQCNGYYNLYKSEYTRKDGIITLIKQETRICDVRLEAGHYDTNYSGSDMPYVRVSG